MIWLDTSLLGNYPSLVHISNGISSRNFCECTVYVIWAGMIYAAFRQFALQTIPSLCSYVNNVHMSNEVKKLYERIFKYNVIAI